MIRTGLQVITDALKLLGVVAGHEVPTSAEQADALARLNELIDAWGLQQTLLVSRRDVVPLVADQRSTESAASESGSSVGERLIVERLLTGSG